MEVLEYLLRNPGRAVSRAEILDALWPATRVATGSLTQAIWEIRRALSEQPDGDRIIKTLRRGRGYRLDARVAPGRRGHQLDGAGGGAADVLSPHAVQERLRMLSSETQSIVFDLAMLLARQATGGLQATRRDPVAPPRSAGAVQLRLAERER